MEHVMADKVEIPQASPGAVAFYEALGFEADRVGDFPEYPGFSLDLRQ